MALPRKSIPRDRSGFALIVAVVLMSFILLILLSLSLYSRIEMGTAASQVHLSQARENARLGMLEALAALQVAAGADQRVTARAEILEGRGVDVLDENRYWTGVWNVEEDDLLDYSDSALTRDSATGNIDKNNDQATWLVSHDPSVTLTGPEADLAAIQNADGLYGMVDLLKYAVDDENAVQQAGRVPVPSDSGSVEGTYAWWVADEGLKAKINTRDRSQDIIANGTSEKRLKNQLPFLASRKTNLNVLDDYTEVLEVNDSMSDRLADFGSLEALTSDKADADQISREHIHDLTFDSYGVLSDTLHGGLKLDLTRGLDDQWQQFLQALEPNTSNWYGGEWPEPQSIFKAPWPDDYPAASMGYPISSEDYGIWGPYWDILYQYYNLYKPTIPLYPEIKVGVVKVSKSNDGLLYDFTGYKTPSGGSPANIADVNDLTPSVEPRGAGPGGGHSANEPQYESSGYYIPMPEFSKHKPYRGNWFGLPKTVALNRGKQYDEAFRREPLWNQMQPVLIRSQMGFGLSTFETSTPPTVNDDGSEDHYYKVRIHLYPAVVLWNPYNVNLQAKDYRITIEPHLKIQLYDNPISGEGGSISGDYGGDHYYFRGVKIPDESTNWALQSSIRGYPLEELLNENAWGDEVANSGTTDVYDPRVQNAGNLGYFGGESSTFSLNFVIRQASFEPGEIKIFGLSDDNAGNDIPFSDGDLELLEGATTDTGVYVELHQTAEDTQFHGGKRRVAINEIPVTFEADPVNPAHKVPSPEKTYYFKFFANSKDSFYQWKGSQIDFNLSMLDETLTPSSNQAEVDIGGGLTNAQFFDENSDFIKERNGLLALPISASAVTATVGVPRVPSAEKLLIMDWRLKGTELGTDGVPVISQFSPRRITANRLFTKVETPFPETLLGQLYEHHVYGDGREYPADGTGDILDIDSNGSRAFWGEDSSFNSHSQVILYEVPRQPLQSVGAIMHANLSFYDTMPAYAVGNSYASPYVPTDATSTWKYIERLEIVNTDNYVFADYSYLLNNELFDRFFFSTVPPNYSTGSNQDYAVLRSKLPPFKALDAAYIEAGEPLPNSAMTYFTKDGESTEDTLEKLQGTQALTTAASRLLVDGAFNVNSTSVEAWMAFLAGSAFGPDEYLDINSIDGGDTRLDDEQLGFPVSRFSSPRGSNSGSSGSWQWRGFRSLDKDQLKSLAENIVAEVKKRGPFPSMADFVNRRLVNGELGRRGALQAAIDKSVVNDDPLYTRSVAPSGKDSSPYDDTNGMIEANTVAVQAAGIPGWVSQNDVLRVYGPLMSVRSDTFTIRAYGDSIDPLTQKVRGRAWCEAVVQRLPEFVNGDDAPEVAVNKQAEAHGVWAQNEDLADENKLFGRRFELISFRWLNEDEI